MKRSLSPKPTQEANRISNMSSFRCWQNSLPHFEFLFDTPDQTRPDHTTQNHHRPPRPPQTTAPQPRPGTDSKSKPASQEPPKGFQKSLTTNMHCLSKHRSTATTDHHSGTLTTSGVDNGKRMNPNGPNSGLELLLALDQLEAPDFLFLPVWRHDNVSKLPRLPPPSP